VYLSSALAHLSVPWRGARHVADAQTCPSFRAGIEPEFQGAKRPLAWMAAVVSRKGRSVTRRKARHGRRVGSARRQVIWIIAVFTMLAGLLFSVRRSSEGTLLAESIGELRQEVKLLEEQLSYEIVRVDSLSSLQRISGAAAGLGLREADDSEVLHVADVTEPHASEGDGS
jgi:hypothetical protein